MARPSLIVVTGAPGAGKTTLACTLAPVLRLPVVGRDEIKEGLLRTVGTDHCNSESVARTAYEAFFDSLAFLLERRVSTIAEAAFQHRLWAPRLERLQDIAKIRLVILALDPAVALARRTERAERDPERASYHQEDLGLKPYEPPKLNLPTLTVDVTNGYDPGFEAIVDFARG